MKYLSLILNVVIKNIEPIGKVKVDQNIQFRIADGSRTCDIGTSFKSQDDATDLVGVIYDQNGLILLLK